MSTTEQQTRAAIAGVLNQRFSHDGRPLELISESSGIPEPELWDCLHQRGSLSLTNQVIADTAGVSERQVKRDRAPDDKRGQMSQSVDPDDDGGLVGLPYACTLPRGHAGDHEWSER